MFKNESLFPLVTGSRMDGWTDFANFFFFLYLFMLMEFICSFKEKIKKVIRNEQQKYVYYIR